MATSGRMDIVGLGAARFIPSPHFEFAQHSVDSG